MSGPIGKSFKYMEAIYIWVDMICFTIPNILILPILFWIGFKIQTIQTDLTLNANWREVNSKINPELNYNNQYDY